MVFNSFTANNSSILSYLIKLLIKKQKVMKKFKTSRMNIIVVCILSLTCFGCKQQTAKEPNNKNTAQLEVKSISDSESLKTREKIIDSLAKTLPVGDETFNKMSNFIKTKGTKLSNGDYQYVFFDSNGARHCFMWIDKTSKEHSNIQDKSDQISVWAYRNGQKNGDLKNLGSYCIHRESIYDFRMEDYDFIKFGYTQFKYKVLKN